MTNLFKKTLVAAAVMATASSAFADPTIEIDDGDVVTISQEGAAGEDSIELPTVTVTLDDEYAVNDRLVFSISGATVSENNATLTSSSGNIQLGRLASDDANEAIFRITSLADDGAGSTQPTTGEALVLAGLDLDTDSVIGDAGDVTVSFIGRLQDGTVIESTDAETAIEVESQFDLGDVTALDATIDVNQDRQTFVDDDEDELSISIDEVDDLTFAATATTVTHVLFGNFAYVDTDGDGDADVDIVGAGDNNDTFDDAEFSDDFMSVTLVQTVVGDIDTATVTIDAPGVDEDNPTLEAQSFSATVTLGYTFGDDGEDEVELATEASVGSWDLNGAQVFAPYVPVNFAGLINRIILVNDGVQDGEIEVEAFDESGNAYPAVDLGVTLEGGSNVSITGSQIAEALSIDSAEKLSVTFTINAPAEDVTATGFSQSAAGRQLIDIE